MGWMSAAKADREEHHKGLDGNNSVYSLARTLRACANGVAAASIRLLASKTPAPFFTIQETDLWRLIRRPASPLNAVGEGCEHYDELLL
jgi:hypothetical protein